MINSRQTSKSFARLAPIFEDTTARLNAAFKVTVEGTDVMIDPFQPKTIVQAVRDLKLAVMELGRAMAQYQPFKGYLWLVYKCLDGIERLALRWSCWVWRRRG